MKVLLGTQGTYPYYEGGVSIWCQDLINQLSQVEYVIYAIRGHSSERQIHALPPNVQGISHVSLWGIPDPDLHYRADFSAIDLQIRKKNTTEHAIRTFFLPLFESILEAIITDESNPAVLKTCGESLYRLWVYFHEYNWLMTWKHKLTWQAFAQRMEDAHRTSASPEKKNVLNTRGLATAIQVMHHYLIPLLVPIPKADMFHSSAAGMIALVGVLGKHAYNMPFILTEHGVMMREQFIFLSENQTFSLPVKQFLQKLLSFLARLSYLYADVICPVADYNKRWEMRYGADPNKLRTIYNGVDVGRFMPFPKPPETAERPTVVAAARVVPIKDIETMIHASAIVKEKIPNVQFRIYGTLTADPPYVEQCRRLIKQLNVEDNFLLCGHHSDPTQIFNMGDISILSSISEAFPLTVLESMACERPVVATDVGGVSEGIGDCGILVAPRDAQALADGIIHLLSNDEIRLDVGRRARQRILDLFQTQLWAQTHYDLYASFLNTTVT